MSTQENDVAPTSGVCVERWRISAIIGLADAVPMLFLFDEELAKSCLSRIKDHALALRKANV
jgi:hypothetical protein